MDKDSDTRTLLIENRMDELSVVADFLDELAEEWVLSAALVLSLNLVLEEALTNIIIYGFNIGEEHTIEMNFKKSADNISILLTDDGKAYDPTLKEDPDITLSADERPIGGLGIFLIKKIMDKVEYHRMNNKNFLSLTKNI
jgi:serine/threonine-protein kinase RsbW